MNEENQKIEEAIRVIRETARCPNCGKGGLDNLSIEETEYIPHLATTMLKIKCLYCNAVYSIFFLDEEILEAMRLEEEKQKEEKEE